MVMILEDPDALSPPPATGVCVGLLFELEVEDAFGCPALKPTATPTEPDNGSAPPAGAGASARKSAYCFSVLVLGVLQPPRTLGQLPQNQAPRG